MGDTLRAGEAGEYKIDHQSQQMLRELHEDRWIGAPALCKAAGLEENTQVFYRMRNYLLPANLATEQPRDEPNAKRQFKLTKGGQQWVAEHAAVIEAPADREEVANLAQEGHDEGTRAGAAVDEFQRELDQVRDDINDVETNLKEISDQQSTDSGSLDFLSNRARKNKKRSVKNERRSEDNEDAIEAIRTRLESVNETSQELPTTESVEAVRTEAEAIGERVDELEKQLNTIAKHLLGEQDQRPARWTKPMYYTVSGVAVAYLLVLGWGAALVPGVVAAVILAGIIGLLSIVSGGAVVIAARRTPVE
jgi:hypothetical protein